MRCRRENSRVATPCRPFLRKRGERRTRNVHVPGWLRASSAKYHRAAQPASGGSASEHKAHAWRSCVCGPPGTRGGAQKPKALGGGVLGARDPLGGRSPHGQQQRAGPGRHARATESGRSRREVASASKQAKVRRESRQDSRRGRQAGNWTPKSPGKGVAAGGPRKLLAQGPRGTLILTAQNSGRWCEKNSEHRLVSGPCARAPW